MTPAGPSQAAAVRRTSHGPPDSTRQADSAKRYTTTASQPAAAWSRTSPPSSATRDAFHGRTTRSSAPKPAGWTPLRSRYWKATTPRLATTPARTWAAANAILARGVDKGRRRPTRRPRRQCSTAPKRTTTMPSRARAVSSRSTGERRSARGQAGAPSRLTKGPGRRQASGRVVQSQSRVTAMTPSEASTLGARPNPWGASRTSMTSATRAKARQIAATPKPCRRNVARARSRSVGETVAVSSRSPASLRIAKVLGAACWSAPAALVCTATGTSADSTRNPRPGAPDTPSNADRTRSVATAPTRRFCSPAVLKTGSTHTNRRPIGPGAANTAAPPSRRSAGRLDGRPRQATGVPSAA